MRGSNAFLHLPRPRVGHGDGMVVELSCRLGGAAARLPVFGNAVPHGDALRKRGVRIELAAEPIIEPCYILTHGEHPVRRDMNDVRFDRCRPGPGMGVWWGGHFSRPA